MDTRDLNYYLSINESALHNYFSGGTGGNLNMRSVSFRTSISGYNLSVQVSANLEYSGGGFYTRSYAQSHFEEACREYVEEQLERMDDDNYNSVSYRFSLSLSQM